MAKTTLADYALVFHSDGVSYRWTVHEGGKIDGAQIMSSNAYPSYEAMRNACGKLFKAVAADNFEVYDCEHNTKTEAVEVLAITKVPGTKPRWHVVTNQNWVLQMDCDICPCKRGDKVKLDGKSVIAGTHHYTILQVHTSDYGFSVYRVREVK
jgi:hypothetical protein